MRSAVSAYAFINAKLRGRISKIISHDTLMQMAQAPSLEEMVQMLQETNYSSALDVYGATGDLLMVELEIERIYRAAQEDVYRYTRQFSDPAVADFVTALLIQFEISEVKNAARLWFERVFRERSVEDKVPYLIRSGDSWIESILNSADSTALLQAVAQRPYAGIFAGVIEEVDTRHSLFPLEIALDRWYYKNLKSTLSKLSRRDETIARRIMGIEIDVININWIVRSKTFYDQEISGTSLLDGGTLTAADEVETAIESQHPVQHLTDLLGKRLGTPQMDAEPGADHAGSSVRNLAFLESLLQQLLVYESRKTLGGYPFTIGTILAYFALWRQEARSITTILNGKYYNLSQNRIGALL